MKMPMHKITVSTTAQRIVRTVLFFAILGFISFSFSPDIHARAKEKQTKKTQQSPKPEYGFNDVVEKAQRLSSAAYEDPRGKMPQWLLDITYDQMRDIRFIPDKSHWRKENLPFELQFFHAGLYFDRTVKINEILPAGPVPIRFSTDFLSMKKAPQELKDKNSPGPWVCRLQNSLQLE